MGSDQGGAIDRTCGGRAKKRLTEVKDNRVKSQATNSYHRKILFFRYFLHRRYFFGGEIDILKKKLEKRPTLFCTKNTLTTKL